MSGWHLQGEIDQQDCSQKRVRALAGVRPQRRRKGVLNLKEEGLGSKWEGMGVVFQVQETLEESLSRLLRVLFSVLL